jgi:hypothetical protein
MPKSKRTGIIAKAVRARRARRVAARVNPSSDTGATFTTIGVGVGAYLGTRVVQRLASTVVRKKRPSWAKHLHALGGLVSFGALWVATSRVAQLKPHREAMLIGSGVAAVQGVVGAYIPKYAWLMSEGKELAAGAQNPQLEESTGTGAYDDYLESELSKYESPKRGRKVQQALETAAAADGHQGIDDALLEELGTGEDLDDLYGGVFQDPTLMN